MSSASDRLAPEEAATRTAEHAVCISCGAERMGPYCSRCGQREMRGRHTLRGMATGVLARILNLESGFIHTAVGLTVRPGTVISDFIAGRTRPYTNPVAYLVVAFAAFALMNGVLGGGTGGGDNRVFAALLIPFIAAASRVIFLRGRLNYAEHLILVMYLFAHVVLGLAAAHLLIPFASDVVLRRMGVAVAVAAAALIAWSYSRIFTRRIPAAIGGLAAVAAGAALWMFALIRILNLLRD